MKKLTSLLLACLLAFACLTALGGCGKEATDKEAFIASESYYGKLVETLAAPVADIDSDALADAAVGCSGRVKLALAGLDSLASIPGVEAADLGDSFALDVGFVSNGPALSGDLSLTMLGETLGALFSSDGSGEIALSLPDLLPRPLLLTRDMLEGLNYRYNDYPDYDDDGYDFESDEELDYLDPDDGYDYDDFDDEELDDEFGEEDYDFGDWNEDVDDGQDYYPEYDGDFGSMPALESYAAYASLIARYGDRFLSNVSDGCYSSGREKFRTASGETELDCLTLKADGVELAAALQKTFAEIAEDPQLDELFGEAAEQTREALREIASEDLTEDMKEQYKTLTVTWTRFTRDGATLGERLNLKHPDGEYTLEAGVDSGLTSAFGFLKLTDEKQGVDLLDAESTVGSDKAKLKLAVVAEGVPYSLEINGKTSERDGAKVTDAAVKFGFGGLSFDLFSVTTTVREFSESRIDFDAELTLNLPAMLVGGDTELTLLLSADIGRDASATPSAIDVSDAYTQEEMESDELSAALENALKEKFPRLFELLTAAAQNGITA